MRMCTGRETSLSCLEAATHSLPPHGRPRLRRARQLESICAMYDPTQLPRADPLPFFLASPEETDVLFIAVSVVLAIAIVGLGTLSLTFRGWPDRLVKGANKSQIQLVAILGLLSLITFNNFIWLAALVLAVVRFPDIVTPLRDIAAGVRARRAPEE